MRRYWIDANNLHDDHVQFAGDVFHHIFDVCRQTVGHEFEVLVGDGKAYLVQVTDVQKKLAQAKILSSRELPPIRKPYLHLCLSISRFAVFDSVLEKCVELGVKSVKPFYSDFAFIRKASDLSDSRIERWNKIVVSGTQQSGRGDLMAVDKPVDLVDLAQSINPNGTQACLYCYEGNAPSTLADWNKQTRQNTSGLTDIFVFVGSEGGFSHKEIEFIKSKGHMPVSLGEQVLRVETACVTILSVLKYEWGLMSL